MLVLDLEHQYHPATIEQDRIRVRHLLFTADEFVLSDLRIVSFSDEEEREVVRLGLRTDWWTPKPNRAP